MFKQLTRALKYKNYRLFFAGQCISLIGTWLTNVATTWLVYRLTKEQHLPDPAAILGMVTFAGQIPMFLVSPVSGVLVDRWSCHRVLVATQTMALLQSAVLAVLALGKTITIPQLLLLNIFQGLINAFDVPARQSFVVEIIEDREDLPNAIALNSSMFNGARLVGPAVAGALIAGFGEGICFAIDAVSYGAVILALLAMTIMPRQRNLEPRNVRAELKRGFKYVLGFAPIRAELIAVGMLSFFGIGSSVLYPIIADRFSTESHGAQIFGWLTASSGVGALIGSLYLATRKSVVGLGRVIVLSAALSGAGLLLLAYSADLWVAMLAMLCNGFGIIAMLASCNTLMQTIVEDDMRGRVMSFFGMAVMGTAPIGSLAIGWFASRHGENLTIGIAGAGCVFAGLYFAMKLPELREILRPIYMKKGIIAAPDMPEN